MENKELNITYRPIKELKPYKKNAKKHNKEQVEQIVCVEDLCIKQIDMFNLRHIILCAYFYVNKYKTKTYM